MITLSHVGFAYEPGQDVLKDVSLTLEPGSFHFLMGASGAGKTSLLGVLSLNLKPHRGTAELFGHTVAALSRDELPYLRRKIGFVSQDFRLLNHLTIAENIGLPLKVMAEDQSQIDSKVDEMLEWIGLSSYRNQYPQFLSGGQQQRVAIARAVITKPRLLLADEPTGNLDPELSRRFIYLFEALHKMGTTVLIATHDAYLTSLFDYPTLRLKDGKLE